VLAASARADSHRETPRATWSGVSTAQSLFPDRQTRRAQGQADQEAACGAGRSRDDFVAPAAYVLVSAGFIISAIMGRRWDRQDTIQRRKSKQNGVDPSLLIENTAAVQSVVSASGFIQMHSSDDRHLVEEVIDDVNAVEAFEREATKIFPVGGGAQPQQGRSARSLFHV
jgi:hypothetical protein